MFLLEFLGKRFEIRSTAACFQGVLQGDLWNPKLLSILLEEIIKYSQQVVLPSQNKHPKQRTQPKVYKPGPQRHHPVAFQ